MSKKINNEPIVSICCITYNHWYEIIQCIEGFLMQRTNFAFEILIHDDASTDGTAAIIKEYELKYPNLIKPIYQEENQYRKGNGVLVPFVFPRAKGKYLALCEGDDYWTDPLKLQKQVDLLEQHPDINLCFHKTFLNQNGIVKKSKKDYLLYPRYNSVVDVRSIIALDGGYIPTASILIRSKLTDQLSSALKDKPVGDFFIQIISSYPNGAIFINKYMSCYTVSGIGSWSESYSKESVYKKIEFANNIYNSTIQTIEQWKDNHQDTDSAKFFYINQILYIISKYCDTAESFKEAYSKIEPIGNSFFNFLNSKNTVNIKLKLLIFRFIYKVKKIYYAHKHVKKLKNVKYSNQ